MRTESTERVYRGQSVDARRAGRRRQFLDAGLSEFTTSGYAGSSVTSLCRAAGLSRRQFYELFTDREELLVALYDEIQSDARDAVSAALGASDSDDIAVLAAVAMDAYMRSVGVDPRRAEVSFVQIVGVSPAVEERRIAGREVWADYFSSTMGSLVERREMTHERDRYLAIAFIGALTSVVHRWSTSTPRTDPDEVAAVLADILLAFTDL